MATNLEKVSENRENSVDPKMAQSRHLFIDGGIFV
jgi:hypothetical protein